MPLIKSGSKRAISTNIREMMAAGHPRNQSIAAALDTARRYGKKYAEGGDVDPFTGAPLPEPPPRFPQRTRKDTPIDDDYVQELSKSLEGENPISTGLREGMKGLVEYPGKRLQAKPEDQSGPMTEEEAFRINMARQQDANWGAGTALGMVGMGRLPGAAPEGALGIHGGDLHSPQRPPLPIPQPKYGTPEWEEHIFGEINKVLTEPSAGKNAAPELNQSLNELYHGITGKEIPKDSPIAPAAKPAQGMGPAAADWDAASKRYEQIPWEPEPSPRSASKDDYIGTGAFEKVGPQKGSNPGGVYQDPKTGEQWYVKVPKSQDHADNEILAARLYELAGVPVPEIRPTMIEGQPAIASKIVDGPQLGKMGYGLNVKNSIAKDMPIDAWLANWDAIGTGKDNIIMGETGPHRIDMGGSLRYRAQGAPKGDKFGPDVPELKTFLDPKINKDAAEVFGGVDKGLTGGAITRLESITPTQIADLVYKWGPRGEEEKEALIDTLLKRKQAVIDDFYQGQQNNLGKPASLPAPTGDPKGYASALTEVAKIEPYTALTAKNALSPAFKKDVNKALWAMTKTADPETKAIINNLYSGKVKAQAKTAGKTDKEYLDYIQKQKEDYKGTKEKSDAEQAADQAEYEQNMHSSEQHQAAISAGDYSAHPNAPESEQKFKSHPLSEDRFKAIAKEVDWRTWFPTSYAHEIPKKLEFPNAVAHPSTLGFNAKIPLYKGGIQGYHGELMDVMKKWNEKAWFAGHHPDVAKGYSHGTHSYDTYVMRGNKAVEISWPDFTGGQYGYFGTGMNKLIDLAHAKNADILIIHNIVDIAKGKYLGEPHTQYAVLKPRGLRALDAKFDPNKLELSHSHAGLVGGGLFTYGMLRGDNEGNGMNKGGRTPMAAGGFNSAKWIPRPPNLMGGIRPVGGGMPRAITPKASPGLIHSTIPGRTDKIPRSVPGGSYIIPASVVSGMGQGNTLAGADALNKLFAQGPYGDKMQKFGTPKPNFGHPMHMAAPQMRMPKPAKAGGVEEGGDHVPIIVAGGEYQVPPEVVRRLGNGNMKQGHKILDELVMHIRRQTIKDMRKEKPPKK